MTLAGLQERVSKRGVSKGWAGKDLREPPEVRETGGLPAMMARPAAVNEANWEGRISRTSQPWRAWGRTAVRQRRLQMEAGRGSARRRWVVAKARSKRGAKCKGVATASWAPKTTPTMRKVEEDVNVRPATCKV